MEGKADFDFAVIGSGFAGSIMSMVLRRLGYTVLLLERGSHPRFAIGESSTPFSNLLLEVLSQRFDLPVLREFSEWGRWQAAHPKVSAGLKRGFTFFHHRFGEILDPIDRSHQLLVAASPNDRVADTHWYRPEFDAFLVQCAKDLGVTYRDRAELRGVTCSGPQWESEDFTARFIIDASGRQGFLSERFNNADIGFPSMPKTRAEYAHFIDVPRLPSNSAAPYNAEDAAVHHVFDDGWIWVLRFNNGITSAGCALKDSRQSWDQLLARLPTLQEQFRSAKRITPLYKAEPLCFRRTSAIGPRYALLPSAAAFVDPLLSTGFALSLLGVLRFGEAFRDGLKDLDLAAYECSTFAEADAVADLVSALYAKMHSFEEFSLLSMLYFAAMSYTETCWRLGRPELASGFLLTNNSQFTRARVALCKAARNGERISREAVFNAIIPYDITGLSRADRQHWYPVDFQDLINNGDKVQATRREIEALAQKLGI